MTQDDQINEDVDITKRNNIKKNKLPAFELDSRIHLKIEKELAANMGRIILDANTDNTALLAVGHQLINLSTKNKQS